jgi:hypothetical protein
MASQILEDSAALVDAMVLNVGDFTELDFDPRSNGPASPGGLLRLNASSSKPRQRSRPKPHYRESDKAALEKVHLNTPLSQR